MSTVPKTMKAVVWSRYGAAEDVLEVTDIATPLVDAEQVLVRVRAASLNPYDWHFYRGDPYLVRVGRGFRRPKERHQLGADFAGEVVRVGANVEDFAPGDRVFGETHLGSLAQYAAVKVERVAHMPAKASFEQAAAMPMGAHTALAALAKGGERLDGKSVLINGASGGIGHLAVQLAKARGADRVVGVCSGRNAGWVAELGADRVVDYTTEDYTKLGETFDLFVDTQYSQPWYRSMRAIRPGGVFAFAGGGGGKLMGPGGPMLRTLLGGLFTRRKARSVMAYTSGARLAWVAELFDASAVRPVIAESYPLDRIVEAAQHLETGHVAGKVVVAVP